MSPRAWTLPIQRAKHTCTAQQSFALLPAPCAAPCSVAEGLACPACIVHLFQTVVWHWHFEVNCDANSLLCLPQHTCFHLLEAVTMHMLNPGHEVSFFELSISTNSNPHLSNLMLMTCILNLPFQVRCSNTSRTIRIAMASLNMGTNSTTDAYLFDSGCSTSQE
jgi:hypothetical protein